jgi:ABC-type taurine transport system ATPase subunit
VAAETSVGVGGGFVRFAGVSVCYGAGASAVRAVEQAELSFGQGDFVCIVGPSGCGKTTLMQTLAGFLPPTEGAVYLDGRKVDGPGPDRGVVFQQPALFPWLTVAANAGFGPRLLGVAKREATARVERWLRTVGLWEFRDRYPYELSGGMQQRLAIARALCNEPRVLLMDEPFGALDALTRERMQEELHRVWRQTGMTVVFITHSVEEAVYLGTEVVVMSPRPGRIVARLPAPFARGHGEEGIRAVKAGPDFVALREQVLSLVWGMDDTE